MNLSACLLPSAGREQGRAKQALRSHHMQDNDLLPVVAIEDPAGRLDNLAIAGSLQLLRAAAALWIVSQLVDMIENTSNKS